MSGPPVALEDGPHPVACFTHLLRVFPNPFKVA